MCLQPGDILRDRYQIIGQLGEGGFARTYTANDRDQPNNSPCVVKEIRPPQSTLPEVWQRANAQFEIEAAALHRLGQRHSRIPNLIDSFEYGGKFYLIQEYIPGQSLSEELTTGTRWTEEQVIVLLQEILSIIEFVHEQGMVHRDIHPGNLIRRSCDSSIVLIDFGAVREISTLGVTNSGEISTTQAIGTRGYMPAEQLLMPWNPQAYNDIYAIGAIAVQALTHVHPNNLPRDPLSCELLWHYSTPDRVLPQVSDSLRTILNTMVRFPYCDRYHSAADVLQDLISLPQDENLSKQPNSTINNQTVTQTVGVSSQKWRVRLSIAIALVAATGASAIYYSIFLSKTGLVLPDGLSAGDKILVTSSSPWLKQRGVEEFAKSNYQSAFNLFKKSWNEEDSIDPETLIYMNNALLKAKNADHYTIAVAVPILKNQEGSVVNADSAKELLRGVAQAQTEVNLGLIPATERNQNFPGQSFIEAKTIN